MKTAKAPKINTKRKITAGNSEEFAASAPGNTMGPTFSSFYERDSILFGLP